MPHRSTVLDHQPLVDVAQCLHGVLRLAGCCECCVSLLAQFLWLEEYGHEHLRAVLTCMALYGGSVHLAIVPLDGAPVPVATESLYRVHYDWRCELVYVAVRLERD